MVVSFLPIYIYIYSYHSIGTFFRVHWKFLEVLLDSILLVMGAIAFVVSQFILESAVETHVSSTVGLFAHTEYYTLSACYETYAQQVRTTVYLLLWPEL